MVYFNFQLNGCVVNVRPKMDKVAIWTRPGICVESLENSIVELLDKKGDYKVHESFL